MEKIIEFILSNKFYAPIIYVVVAIIVYNVLVKINNNIGKLGKRKSDKKKGTVIRLINSVIKYILVIIVLLMILDLYGVNTTSILASLGIVSLVIGLAFQDTMKNMLSGILIILDDRYNVGDTVKINDFTGEVINLGLQTTKIRDYQGFVFTINNSNIESVINYTENDTNLYLDIPISYDEDIDKVEKVLKKLSSKIEKIENVKGPLSLLGVDSFGDSSIIYKISIPTKPYKHFGVKREVLKLLKITFDKEGIVVPYNQLDVHIKEK